MKKVSTLFLLIASLLFHQSGKAQLYTQKNIGVRVGIVLGLGNRIDRIGVCCNAYYSENFFQANADVRAYYNFRNIGPKKKHAELVTSLGVVFGFGKKDTTDNLFYSPVSNQTRYRNSFGYSYNCYFNKIKTTQQTGIVALQFQGFSIIGENDLFARPRFDRFRTGAFLLQYQYKQFQFAVNSTLWTGQMGKVVQDNNPHFPNGYVDTTNSVYPDCSAGLLSLQFKCTLPYYQFAQGNVGVDAEQVRDVLQNKMIHGLFRAKNSDIPMLDTNGNQYLYKDGQKIKKVRPYYNVFLNPGVFY
ncbi:MAG TPA: polymorphic toxin type 23 domain-containing protein [Bacteroidia bacterium]|nr:polymorphic toxin type 23 domain-containing protein [Bacteroidia bacterium]